MARKNSYFQSLLRRYERCGWREKHHVFELMRKNAKKFAEWNEIHRYGDSNNQYEALEHMKATVFDEKRVIDVQRNILTLFELVTDSAEQNEFLKKYIELHCEKDDLLFAAAICSTDGNVFSTFSDLAMGYYCNIGGLKRGIEARKRKNVRIMENIG